MHHWIFRSENFEPNKPPLATGISAGCVFCRARKYEAPAVGKKVLVLSGSSIGHVGTRIRDSSNHLRTDQFTLRMHYPRGDKDRVHGRFIDLYVVEPFDAIPPWAPPLSLEDTLAIHEGMLRALDATTESDKRLLPIVNACWGRRAPISGEEIWPMALAHGFESISKNTFIRSFDFGMNLLVYARGRQPIKKKRINPFSKGRYLSKRSREHWLEYFGFD